VTAIDVPDPAAASVLRYAEVLASEWHNMRGWLARRDLASPGAGFAISRRSRLIRLPSSAAAEHAPPPMPAVLSAAAVAENTDLAREALYRVRIADRPLTHATTTQCMALITSPFVPDPRPDRIVLLAPDDDEPGRMHARAVTWMPDLPSTWSIDDHRFDVFADLVEEAFGRLAKDPELLATARAVLNSIIVVDHPTQRAGVCSASLGHMWVSSLVIRDAAMLADAIRGGIAHSALYFDELVHAKWAAQPEVLDDTTIRTPLPAFAVPMEFDTAFHAAHIEYLRIRSVHLATGRVGDLTAVRRVIAEMQEHPDLLTEHGSALLRELDRLAAGADA